jgi:DnaJ-class molecular chaperone
MNQSEDTCPTCFGTGNNPVVRSPYPIRKILFDPCPDCGGSGVRPPSPPSPMSDAAQRP